MSTFTEQLAREHDALIAAGYEAATRHRSSLESRLPTVRLYPVAPAHGTASAAAAALWQTAVPGGRQLVRAVSSGVSALTGASAERTKASVVAASPASTALAARQDAQTRETVARLAVPGATTTSNVLVAASTSALLEAFLSSIEAGPDTTVLVPGLLLSPFGALLAVLQSFRVRIVGFDFNTQTMEADVSGLRAALTGAAAAAVGCRQCVLLLVNLRGRGFANVDALKEAAASTAQCSVVCVGVPTAAPLSAPARTAMNPVARAISPSGAAAAAASAVLPSSTARLHLTSFDAAGSLGGAVGYCPSDPALATAMRARLDMLPAAGFLQSWRRLAKYVCSVLLSERMDYGTTMWTLALLSRAAATVGKMLAPYSKPPAAAAAAAAAVKGQEPPAPGADGRDGDDYWGLAASTDGARAQAVEWICDLFAAQEAFPVDVARGRDSAGDGVAWPRAPLEAITRLVRRTTVGALLLPDAGPRTEEKTAPAGVSGDAAVKRPNGAYIAAPTSTKPQDALLRWMEALLRDQRAHKDADVLCLWAFLSGLPSYVRVVSADGSSSDGKIRAVDPVCCVEAPLTSVVVRATCPAHIARRLQQAGFAAMPSKAVSFSPSSGLPAPVPRAVSGVVYVEGCAQCAAAAPQLCFVPLSANLSIGSHQLLVDVLSEMPRAWHLFEPAPVSRPSLTGRYQQKTDGKNHSNTDRPYATPAVRALLYEMAIRYGGNAGTSAGSGAAGTLSDAELDRRVKAAQQRLSRSRPPILTFLLYGTQAARLMLPKL